MSVKVLKAAVVAVASVTAATIFSAATPSTACAQDNGCASRGYTACELIGGYYRVAGEVQ